MKSPLADGYRWLQPVVAGQNSVQPAITTGLQPERPSPDPVQTSTLCTSGAHTQRMGLIFRKRIRLGRSTTANVSRSGVSVTKRAGRVTVNSRGRVSVRILPGLTWRGKL